jgi:hypothetical protein
MPQNSYVSVSLKVLWAKVAVRNSGRVGVVAGCNGTVIVQMVAGRLTSKVGRAHLKHT